MLRTQAAKYEQIKNEIIELGDFILAQNQNIFAALKNNDLKALESAKEELRVDLRDKAETIDNTIITALALYAPEARDLREVVAFFKLTNEIIRLHLNTSSFVKKFSKSYSSDLKQDDILEYALPLYKSSNEALKLAISMIPMTDKDDVRNCFDEVMMEESKADDLYKMVEKNLLKMTKKDQEFMKEYLDVLSALRHLEKNADRAFSIATLMFFAKVGGEIRQA